MDTSTLEGRIREKAQETLKAEIRAAGEPLDRLLRVGCGIPCKIAVDGTGTIYSHRALEAVKNAIYATYRERREQDAIDEFLKEVERLRSEVNELVNLER